jgi:hypothetical protein
MLFALAGKHRITIAQNLSRCTKLYDIAHLCTF